MKIFLPALTAVLVSFAVAAEPSPPPSVSIPSFWDPDAQIERPELVGVRAVRFLTDDDYPPLDFALPDGALAGFNVDMARAVCAELQVACTIQARRWDTLVDSLLAGKGDAVAASLAATPAVRANVDFTKPYYKSPARFIVRKDSKLADATPTTLIGKAVGVIEGSAHKAYLDAFFPKIVEKTFPDVAALREALRSGQIDAAFGDGLSWAVWLGGSASADCCAFKGGPYLESKYFGEGVGIAVKKGNDLLRQAFNWGLFRLWEKGRFTDLWLRYFPISPF